MVLRMWPSRRLLTPSRLSRRARHDERRQRAITTATRRWKTYSSGMIRRQTRVSRDRDEERDEATEGARTSLSMRMRMSSGGMGVELRDCPSRANAIRDSGIEWQPERNGALGLSQEKMVGRRR
jgi:hypothetical protein